MVNKINEALNPGCWISVDAELPQAGDYWAKVNRNGEIIELKKRFMVSNGDSHWFGGCRPFSDNDVVLAWYKTSEPVTGGD